MRESMGTLIDAFATAAAMNLLSHMTRLRGMLAPTAGWLLSREIRLSAGFVSSCRLLLYGLDQSMWCSRPCRWGCPG
jgi:hypothetical protein